MLAPAVAWQTTSRGLPARTRMLTVAGVDVAAPVSSGAGNSYGVDPRSMDLTEAAAGAVSRLAFTITDPAGAVAVNLMDPVVLWDITRDMPAFSGFVQRAKARRLGVGRTIEVQAIGIEAVLDWAYVPPFTLGSGTDMVGALQAIASAAVGVNGIPLRWAMDPAGSTVQYPIEGAITGLPIGAAYTVAGGTLRQALRSYAEWLAGVLGTDSWAGNAWWITVDFYGGLRIWTYDPATHTNPLTWGGGAVDMLAGATLSVAGPIRPSDTEYEVDATSTPRTAVITGSAAAVTVAGDGTGLPGPSVAKTDTNATTAAQRFGMAAAMLGAQAGGIVGSVTAEGTLNMGTFGSQVRPGAPLQIDDAQAGISPAIATWIGSISKTFAPSGEETWRLDFGSKGSRTATGLLRRLAQGELA